MKTLFSLSLLFVLLTACSTSGDSIIGQEIVPIATVDAPETLTVGIKATFVIQYRLPTTCHEFFRLNFNVVDKTTTVSVVTSIKDGNCNNSNNIQTATVDATPNEAGIFTFKFFAGNDANGTPTFIIKEYDVAPVPIG